MKTSLPSARLVFAGGGTGGHLFPAVAIADRISELLAGKSRVEISFVGTRRGIEYRLRDRLGYPLHLVRIRGLARSFTLSNLLVPFLVIGALIRARSILKQTDPHIVVGTGGYVAWPVLKMASVLKLTTVLQEQNSFPGITTRRLAANASRIYIGFEQASEYLMTEANILVTGNPVRNSILGGDHDEAMNKFNLDSSKKTILILGGSQGARAINQAVMESLRNGSLPDGYQLLWQTGKRDYRDVVASLTNRMETCSLFPFAEEMNLVYAAADLAIARAGALTLAELEACRIPALLIPYPHAAGDHQRKNAQAYVDKGFAGVIQSGKLNSVDILARAVALFENSQAQQMRRAMEQANAGRKAPVDVIAEDIIELLTKQQEASVGV